MTLSFDDEEFENIQRRCSAATPGPWISSWEGRDHTSGDRRQYDDLYLSACTMEDQDFIAHAREDVPALVEEVLRLRRILKAHGLEVK